MNVITYFVLSHILKFFFQKKKNLRTFKEKLQKKGTKMRHVVTPIQPDLSGPQFIKRNFQSYQVSTHPFQGGALI